MYRIIGALKSFPNRVGNLDLGRKSDNYGQEWPSTMLLYRLVFFGEIHSRPEIVQRQEDVLQQMIATGDSVHVIMEHFSLDMQQLLDDYTQGRCSFEELIQQYQDIGTEGHDLKPYESFLEKTRQSSSVFLHAGFLSRTYARQLMKEGEAAALQSARLWLPPDTTQLQGNEFHYNIFESMITGRNLAEDAPSDTFRGIFQAQLLKDVAMAHKINTIIEGHPNDRFLVLAGNGHVSHYQGVPERVLAQHPDLIPQSCLIVSRVWNETTLISDAAAVQIVSSSYENAADYVLAYQERKTEDAVKQDVAEMYNQVGDTAHLEGNLMRARAILKYLEYTDEDIAVAGRDAYNYQGVGNPHKHAQIQPGERVLDVGSGLGVDSFIAAHRTGPHGRVIGIDLSHSEVEHANRRALSREMKHLEFMVADMEHIPLPDASMDVIVSNGAFCLAPNKKKAFAELFRVLRPGGRIAICTSTLRSKQLPEGIQWPLCMEMFIAKDQLEPMCSELGFENIVIDDSHSKMVYELPEEEETSTLNPDRHRVHGNNPAFRHLEEFNMNELCARVCVVAKKPLGDDDVQSEQQDAL
ncbi:hypothetical protein FisN_24Hu262 [Fistulifera solaris]|uniref:Arsenite methyltransferase n=1 Tax=Fistulifera solaris TaxID=1519565 RepID=A0A1Z5K3D3_FISSO|nr:hypothetical protein FisN_24Hu262 [Fistulifera solaris]|eukprot:GAX20488.1 hypothetical protein FisN_24Hu262 [Fistulifera solaris]